MPLPADAPPPWSTTADAGRPATPTDASAHHVPRPRSSSRSQLPVLPPITRVSSDTDLVFEISTAARPASQGSRAPFGHNMSTDGPSGYMGNTLPHHHLRPDSRSASSPNPGALSPESARSRRKAPPPPINTGSIIHPPPAQPSPPKSATSFVAPTDRPSNHGVLSSSQGGPGNAALERSHLPPAVVPEALKGKKGLPFFKASITKLLPGKKRKPRETSSSLQPLPLAPEPITADPRIHGTRVHDFSAPRPRRIPSTQEALPHAQAPVSGSMPHGVGTAPRPRPGGRDSMERHAPRGVPREPWGSLETYPESPPPAPIEKDSPVGPVPPVPPKDTSPVSVGTSTSTPSRGPSAVGSDPNRPGSSTRTSISRNVSVGGSSTRRTATLSALPRHMKSTSSRFSFDMIGAASQEKTLEERHRQRAQDKQISDASSGAPRDSRFDDFNDNDFDYDAMMDDDGLDMEEGIPGVNVEYEEDIPMVGDFDEDDMEEDVPLVGDFEEDAAAALAGNDDVPFNPELGPTAVDTDPDNDQENFAGFHFQRSNPASSLASPLTPGVLPTPRDAEGMAIGFAMTKDTTPDVPNAHSPLFPQHLPPLSPLDGEVSGLGVRLQTDPPAQWQTPPQQEQRAVSDPPPPARALGDDFDFDDGLADELDFKHDGPAFDESIFDNNDTDQYGRPIPGAFAKAQQAMQAMHQPTSNRTSDGTAHSAVQSTAPTSLGTNLHPSVDQERPEFGAAAEPCLSPGIPGQDLAYQAALAQAAQQAAASGKFRRSSSPPLPAELTVTSPTDSHVSQYRDHDSFEAALEDELDDYGNDLDDYGNGLDDYEYDDDFIAEANASVLANDADGFYGQEFGFYSAPLPGKDHGSSSSGSGGALSAENLSQYANGGFFYSGPARTKSGRVVSRDPNLTPITERSEYSNRNSIMSLAMPAGFDARSPPAQSPGLAQLAMSMSSDDMDHHKNLSDLLKLRSRAWGGSQASLPNSREGSPRAEHAPPSNGGAAMGSSPWSPPSGAAPGLSGALPNGRRGSALSVWSTSDALAGIGNFPASPISAVSALSLPVSPDGGPGLAPSPFSPPLGHVAPLSPGLPLNSTVPTKVCTPVLEDDECRNYDPVGDEDYGVQSLPPLMSGPPASPKQARRPGIGHRHKGSADSISYTKEDEPESGGTIWVMERRRTADSGEVEILGREVVDGGKI